MIGSAGVSAANPSRNFCTAAVVASCFIADSRAEFASTPLISDVIAVPGTPPRLVVPSAGPQGLAHTGGPMLPPEAVAGTYEGLTLPALLESRRAQAAVPGPGRPRAKACIVLFFLGGPPQHETWDPKPDAPAEIRGGAPGLYGAQSRQALDLGQESAAVRDRYGRARFGQSVLLARRLVEAGVALVRVNWTRVAGAPNNGHWDTHASLPVERTWVSGRVFRVAWRD
jgi:hypothetical protein